MVQKLAPAAEALVLIEEAQKTLHSIFAGTDFEHIGLVVEGQLNVIRNRLAFHSGQNIAATHAVEFPPVTDFMGESIGLSGEVALEDLQPAQSDRDLFFKKVNLLQDGLTALTPEAVLSSYTTPEDQLVLRGLAKRLGLEDYRDGLLNIDFIDRMKGALPAFQEHQANLRVLATPSIPAGVKSNIEVQIDKLEVQHAQKQEELSVAQGVLASAENAAARDKAQTTIVALQQEVSALSTSIAELYQQLSDEEEGSEPQS